MEINLIRKVNYGESEQHILVLDNHRNGRKLLGGSKGSYMFPWNGAAQTGTVVTAQHGDGAGSLGQDTLSRAAPCPQSHGKRTRPSVSV